MTLDPEGSINFYTYPEVLQSEAPHATKKHENVMSTSCLDSRASKYSACRRLRRRDVRTDEYGENSPDELG